MSPDSIHLRLRAQRLTLVLGALYDLAFAAAMLVAPQATADAFGLPLPGPTFYVPLLAVLLGMLASLYLAAAYDLRRLWVVPWVAGVGRLAGALVFATAALRGPMLESLWSLAAADAAFGILHLLFNRSSGVAATR